MINQALMAQRTLRLVNGYWDKYNMAIFKKNRHVYSLSPLEYRIGYLFICRKMVKSSCRLRRLWGFKFAYSVLGSKFANDILFTIGSKTLVKGKIYNQENLRLLGWTEGDGTETEGYNCWDYFDRTSCYLGPDQHGIEPRFEFEEEEE